MTNCPAITAKGTPCKGLVKPGNEYCPAHDPARAEDRRRVASLAGRGNLRGGEIVEIKARIKELAEGVISGEVDRGKASVAFQGLGVLKGFLELERRIKETEELATRIEALEETQGQGGTRGRQWGA
jgi:hypothetical protein